MADAGETYTITKDGSFKFLEDLVKIMIKDGLMTATDRDRKVCEFKHPDELRAVFPDLQVEEEPTSQATLLELCRRIIQYSVKTGHPRFFNQLWSGMDQYSLGGSWLTETLNTSQYTYEAAPVFTLMEKEIYQKMLGLVGFNKGEGIFTPGGSTANFYGLNLARYAKFPDIKTKGMMCLDKPLCMFTSEKAHYSMMKAAALIGLGTNNVIPVKVDGEGKMMPSALEDAIQKAIAEGYTPFCVNATAGTTVYGAFDPLDEIAEVCGRHGCWMHVDAAHGGGALLSRTHRQYLKGIDRADSVTWNPHKMMGVPLLCAVFLTKHKGLMNECHSAQAKYLFQQDKHYDTSYDTGDMSLQCGRKVDVLKLWMQWKGKGDLGMERDIDHIFANSRYLAKKIKETEGFRLINEPQCTNVCFWYIPPSLRGQQETDEWWQKLGKMEPRCTNVCFWYIPPSLQGQQETEEWWQILGKVAPAIKMRMMQRGSMMICYQPEGELVNFFRMIHSNFDTTTDDLDFLVEEMHRLGQDL